MDRLPQRTSGEWDTLIRRYQNMVYGLALARTGSPADADDVFQEVFLTLFQSGRSFRDEEHRKAWLLRTTINLSRRVTSSSWRTRTVPLEEQPDTPVPFQDPEEHEIWDALAALPETLRIPLYLFYFQELSTGEIARALSIRPGTVRMRLSRGREMLRTSLKGEYFS